jgi:hypothetical protein
LAPGDTQDTAGAPLADDVARVRLATSPFRDEQLNPGASRRAVRSM